MKNGDPCFDPVPSSLPPGRCPPPPPSYSYSMYGLVLLFPTLFFGSSILWSPFSNKFMNFPGSSQQPCCLCP